MLGKKDYENWSIIHLLKVTWPWVYEYTLKEKVSLPSRDDLTEAPSLQLAPTMEGFLEFQHKNLECESHSTT